MIAKNWMPTVAGIASGISSLALFLYLGDFVVFPKWALGILAFIQAGGAAGLGIVAKQYNVTGGEIGQPSTKQALKDANQAPATGAAAPKAV
jgi:hypothetical protein